MIAKVNIEPLLMLNLKVVGSLQSGKGRVLKVGKLCSRTVKVSEKVMISCDRNTN